MVKSVKKTDILDDVIIDPLLDLDLVDETDLDDEDKRNKKKSTPPNENNPDEVIARQVIEDTLTSSVVKLTLDALKDVPASMDALILESGYTSQGLRKGQEVSATITDKSKNTVYFDLGAKTEGILIAKEVEYVKDYVTFLRVGDTVKAVVVSPENDKGQILLSLRKAATDWKWDLFERYLKSGESIEVRGLDINRGGMIARVLNVHGFIPVSQFGRQWVGKLEQLYNKVFPVRIIEVDRSKNRLIFSEKAISESEILEKQHKLLEQVNTGTTYQGEVSGVMPFGIFVRVFVDQEAKDSGAFLDGLVHISEISWEKVSDVSSIFKVDDPVSVQVIDIDKENGKLNLSIKRLQSNPWDIIVQQLPIDKRTQGVITRLAPYGAFVRLGQGIEGLIHVSKIPSDSDFKPGQEVEVYVESIDVPHHRVSLGLVLSTKPVGYK